MFIFLIIVIFLVCVVGLFVTFSVGKEVDATIEKRKEEKNKLQQEKERFHSYEHSFTNVRLILAIYGTAFLFAIILFVVFVF